VATAASTMEPRSQPADVSSMTRSAASATRSSCVATSTAVPFDAACRKASTTTIEFASSWLDWNEFTYWTYSTLADGSVVASRGIWPAL